MVFLNKGNAALFTYSYVIVSYILTHAKHSWLSYNVKFYLFQIFMMDQTLAAVSLTQWNIPREKCNWKNSRITLSQTNMDIFSCARHSYSVNRTKTRHFTSKMLLASFIMGLFCCASTAGKPFNFKLFMN